MQVKSIVVVAYSAYRSANICECTLTFLNVTFLFRMVDKNAAKRPSATEALSFPVVSKPYQVLVLSFFYEIYCILFSKKGKKLS